MRLLHVADLHLGKKIFGFDLLEDQKYVLQQIKAYISEYKPDALLLAGDIYDRSNPSAEALGVFDAFAAQVLLELKTPILAVAGNHDGAQLIGYGRQLLGKVGLHVEGVFSAQVRKVVLCDEHGAVNFYLLPFADYQVVRDVLGDSQIKSLNEAMLATMEQLRQDFDPLARNVLLTHGYITGGGDLELSASEKPLSIGGKDYVSADSLAIFNYVALGHLHQAQRVGSDKIRYAGSILKYSFSEEQHKKSVTLVELDGAGQVSIQLLPLQPLHDMRTLVGELAELLQNVRTDLTDCYLQVILTDCGEPIEPKRQLDAIYKRIMLFGMQNRLDTLRHSQLAGIERRNKTPLELCDEFCVFCTEHHLSEAERSILEQLIEQAD